MFLRCLAWRVTDTDRFELLSGVATGLAEAGIGQVETLRADTAGQVANVSVNVGDTVGAVATLVHRQAAGTC